MRSQKHGQDYINLGKKMASLREASGTTQAQLSKELSISQSTLAGYELGIRKPSVTTVKKIAGYFGVSTDYLLDITKVDSQTKIDIEGWSEVEREYLENTKKMLIKLREKRNPIE